MFSVNAGTGKAVRLTGFTLLTTSATMELVAIAGVSANIRIDHSRFDATAGATAVQLAERVARSVARIGVVVGHAG